MGIWEGRQTRWVGGELMGNPSSTQGGLESVGSQGEDCNKNVGSPRGRTCVQEGYRKKSGLKSRRYENQRSGRKCLAGQPERLQESRECGGRLAVHITSIEELRVGETKGSINKGMGGVMLRRQKGGKAFCSGTRPSFLSWNEGSEVDIAT